MTIRKKLALWYTGAFTVILMIFSVAVITVSHISVYSTIDQILDEAARDLVRGIRVETADTPGEMALTFLHEEFFHAPTLYTQVWQTRHDGQAITPRLVRKSSNLDEMEEPLVQLPPGLAEPLFARSHISGTSTRVLARPYYSPGGDTMGFVQIATSIENVEHTNEVLIVITLIALTISIIVTIVLSLWLSNRLLRPIDNIARAAASVAQAQDLSTRLEWRGPPDELGQLVDSFNHMMQRLEHLFSIQQRFVSDVSHELRTPLTSIVGNLEIMERYGVDQSSLDAVQREAARMSRMVNDLLLLARADYGEIQVELFPLELDPLVLETYEQAHMLAKGRNLKLVLGDLEAARINGNSDRLKQLLLNLVNNAIKFTPDGGRITLSLRVEDHFAVVAVADTGIGIGPDDLARIFDRFYQADNSRAQRTDNDGAGLGLSIVRWIVASHRGTIDVKSAPGQGSTFLVRLPLLSADTVPVAPPTRERTFRV